MAKFEAIGAVGRLRGALPQLPNGRLLASMAPTLGSRSAEAIVQTTQSRGCAGEGDFTTGLRLVSSQKGNGGKEGRNGARGNLPAGCEAAPHPVNAKYFSA